MQPNAGGKILEEALANIRRSRNAPTPRRPLQARDESLPRHRCDAAGPQALEARHDLSCAALAHTEELLDRRAVEAGGCRWNAGLLRISSSR